MGRQKGVSERTKKNVKPSSSSRAAESLLLGSHATFESFAGAPAYVPVSKLQDDQLGLPSEFRIALTKLSKKDATTKLKALNDLVELCNTNDENLLVQILPFWSSQFNRLCYEKDRRVREAGQTAMLTLAKSCGREIAPYLKKMIGWWWISQNDFYSLAAKAANDGFVAAFPTEEKQEKVLLFTHDEILTLIEQNLFVTDLRQLTNTTKDEDFAEQLIAGSLKAFASFVRKTAAASKNEKSNKAVAKFFTNPRFWKFHKHKNSMVKRSFYHVITETCLSAPQLLHDHLPVMQKSVFHMLHEKDGVVMKFIWTAADVVTKTFPGEWHTNVDMRAGFLPQFYASIQNGFYGFASQICCFVPLLVSRLPSSIRSDIDVYNKLFLVHREVINSNNNVGKSAAETKAFVVSLVECYQHLMYESSANNQAVRICVDGLLECFRGYVESHADFESNRFAWKYFLQAFVLLLQKLAVECATSADLAEVNAELWNGILKLFTSVAQSIESEGELSCDTQKLIKRFSYFFECFRNDNDVSTNDRFGKSMTKKVKFVENASSTTKVVESQFKNNDPHLTNALCSIFDCLVKSENVTFKLFTFCTMYSTFVDKKLFEGVDVSSFASTHDIPTNFLVGFLLPLLEASTESHRNAWLDCVDFIYRCLQCCDQKGAVLFLNSFYGMSDLGHLKLAVSKRMLEDQLCPDTVREWFYSGDNSMVKFVISSAREFCENDEFWQLLDLICTPWENALECELKMEKSCVLTILKATKQLFEAQHSEEILTKVFHLIPKCLAAYYSDPFFSEILEVYRSCVFEMFALSLVPSICNALGLIEKEYFQSPFAEKYLDLLENFLNECAALIKKGVINNQFESVDAISLVEVLVKAYQVKNFRNNESLFDHLLLIQDEWHQLRRDFSSASWLNHTQLLQSLLLNEFGSDSLSQSCDVDKCYSDNYVNVVEVYSKVFSLVEDLSPSLCSRSTMALEVLTVSRLVDNFDRPRWLSDSDDIASALFDEISEKISSFGYNNGWCNLLQSYLLHFPLQFERVEKLVEPLWEDVTTPKAVNLLMIYIDQIEDVEKLQLRFDELKSHFVDIEVDDGKLEECGLVLAVLVALMRKLHGSSDFEGNALEILDKINTWSKLPQVLNDVKLSDQKAENISFTIACLSFFNEIAVDFSSGHVSLDSDQWDFVLCGIVTWFHVVELSLDEANLATKEFYLLLFRLCQVMSLFDGYLTSEAARKDPALPATLVGEWCEFFSCNANSCLLATYFATRRSDFRLTDRMLPIMSPLLDRVKRDTLLDYAQHLPAYLVPGEVYDEQIQTLLHHTGKQLVSATSCCDRVVSYRLARKILCHPSNDHPSPPFAIAHQLRAISFSLDPYFDHVSAVEAQKRRHRRVVVASDDEDDDDDDDESVDDEVESDDDATVTGNTSDIINYLILFKLLLEQIGHIALDKRHYYVTELNGSESTSVIGKLLPRLLVLLPNRPRADNEQLSMFQREIGDPNPEDEDLMLDHAVCGTYKQLLQSLPVLVRTWYNQHLDKTSRAHIEHYTSEHVSSIITRQELLNVSSQQQPEGLEIQTRIQAREVVAAYRISDAEFEIVVQLPANYPLEPVKLDTLKRAGIPVPQWRYWILQMTSLLQQQNGRIFDALLLWQRKVDKRLDGIEECMICFSVVHGTSQSLPKLTCKTCEKKFHAECLYKWFDTSNQSTCPLCRSPMTFPS